MGKQSGGVGAAAGGGGGGGGEGDTSRDHASEEHEEGGEWSGYVYAQRRARLPGSGHLARKRLRLASVLKKMSYWVRVASNCVYSVVPIVEAIPRLPPESLV